MSGADVRYLDAYRRGLAWFESGQRFHLDGRAVLQLLDRHLSVHVAARQFGDNRVAADEIVRVDLLALFAERRRFTRRWLHVAILALNALTGVDAVLPFAVRTLDRQPIERMIHVVTLSTEFRLRVQL